MALVLALGLAKLLIEGDEPPRLYDLAADPGESRDLAATEPARVMELRRAVAEWDASMVRQVIPPHHPHYGRDRPGRR